MNRSHFLSPFHRAALPPWPCPECKTSSLVLRENTFTLSEAVSSRRFRRHPGWHPELIEEHCSFQMICVNPTCREVVYVLGRQTVELNQDPDQAPGDSYNEDVLYPLFFLPAPPIISVPDRCPSEVTSQVEIAFSLYWPDLDAAGTRFGIALERLLDSVGIAGHAVLGERIKLYKKEEPELGACLLAIKWLRNDATHVTGLSAYQVLEGFEILEYVLEQIFDPGKEKIVKKAVDITQRAEEARRARRAAADGPLVSDFDDIVGSRDDERSE